MLLLFHFGLVNADGHCLQTQQLDQQLDQQQYPAGKKGPGPTHLGRMSVTLLTAVVFTSHAVCGCVSRGDD